MKNNTMKNAIMLFVFVIMLFVLCLGIIILVKANYSKEPVNPLDVTFDGAKDVVTINRLVAVSSEFGRTITEDNAGAFGYLLFDVVNHTNEKRTYQIYATKEELDGIEIQSSYVTLYLTDDRDVPLEGYEGEELSSFNQLSYLNNKPESKLLYYGLIEPNEIVHVKLRAWVSEPYVVDGSASGFSFKVAARAV
ncbi:MAG: hypothetical protein IKF71_00220 [Bacilli bacterium]|nr:hypothetical protein [Bacilli bacterium]